MGQYLLVPALAAVGVVRSRRINASTVGAHGTAIIGGGGHELGSHKCAPQLLSNWTAPIPARIAVLIGAERVAIWADNCMRQILFQDPPNRLFSVCHQVLLFTGRTELCNQLSRETLLGQGHKDESGFHARGLSQDPVP